MPIFLATLAVQKNSQMIRFRTAAEMLETFGMSKGGKEYRRLLGAFERIFGATIFFGTDGMARQATVVHRSRFNFLREAQIGYNRHAEPPVLSPEFENVIVLSDEFYAEIQSHPIPSDLNAVRVLSGAPAVLDVFMWLSYRCFVSKSEELPIFGQRALVVQLGNVEYARPRKFREKLEHWLEIVRAIWPECPARVSEDGRYLRIAPARAVLRKAG